MCGKCKMWLVMVVFALISTAMLSSVKIHAASAEENQMADIETNHVTAVENTQEQITVNIPVKLKITGNSQQNETFSFLLKQNDEQSSMPMISKVQITETKKDAFQIQYEKPGCTDIRSARWPVMEKTGYMTSPSIPWKSIL